MNPQLLELISKVKDISPQLADYWQATAIIESLGYTDRIIQENFGFPDALSLGKYIYENYPKNSPPKPRQTPINYRQKILQEINIFIEQFSRSFVYAIPLIIILLLGQVDTNSTSELIPPELASLFTLATLASLITSSGFVQMISRRGQFYLGLGNPIQAQRICTSLLYLGISASILLGLAGLWFSFYGGLFADEYLILAFLYYLFLSLLWMLLAILSLQIAWGTPIALLGLTALYVFLRLWLRLGALEAQIIALLVTFAMVAGILAIRFQKNKANNSVDSEVKLPRLSATIYLLAPYFGYGILYFSFIFADRIVAGWAISGATGLSFAIDSQYQRTMDLALLNFLLLVPLVEYLGYQVIRYWYAQAKIVTLGEIVSFSRRLRDRYLLVLVAIVLFFGLSVALSVGVFKPSYWETKEIIQVLIGCLGYLFFVIALLNAILLFSLNRVVAVLEAIFPALIINLTIGYIFANLVSVYGAAIGLVSGAAVFMLLSSRKVLQEIEKPDYAYYLGGY